MANIREESLQKHYEWNGKIEVKSRVSVETRADLSLAYTPGVAEPCLAIQKDVNKSYELTRRNNLVAVITDGTAVLGLGDIGPEAGMPVMEGKCILFKEFADVDAFPLCIKSKDVDEIVRTVYLLSGSFGGINLEDIAAPRCFEIERRLIEACDIPIFHDDQHGTAIVVAAALINALKVVGKKIGDIRVAMSGAGAAGLSIAKHIIRLGVDPAKMIICNSRGTVYDGAPNVDPVKNPDLAAMAKITNVDKVAGGIADALKGADVFIGVSAPGTVTKEMISTMAKDAIVFPMANPTPEIMPDEALAGGARIVGTGRSDFPNQINNLLAFPGIFRGALDCRASRINEEMKVATSIALASLIPESELSETNVIPSALNKDVAKVVSAAVIKAAKETGVARI
ncbi:MAG: NADP-dependent malic enzyme [Clostridia bacterium]|nr:NADP-dependent malic enzyme [Clostridia bacterium]